MGDLLKHGKIVRFHRDPSDAGVLFIRASRLDAREETWPIAEALYREVTRLAPGHVEAWNNLGVMAYRRQDLPSAMEAWGQALLLDPASADTHNNVGHMLQSQGKLEPAAVYLARAVRLDPDMGEARVNLALTLQGLGRFRSALRHWGEYLRRAPRGAYVPLARKHVERCREAASA